MILLKEDAYKNYSLYKMQGSDFSYVKEFLDFQRSRLEKIEFFYPYKDEELLAVLEDGIFWGLFDKDRLIATFAIDVDETYAAQLAQIINSCRGKKVVDKAYESSGLMVDADYRGQGIAKVLMKTAVDEALKRRIDICGVVHTLNAASMKTFFSLGFKLSGVWKMSEGYDFVYLLKKYSGDNFMLIDEKILSSAEICDIIEEEKYSPLDQSSDHKELLSQDYVGVSCDNNRIRFIRNYKGEKL